MFEGLAISFVAGFITAIVIFKPGKGLPNNERD